MGYSCEAWLWYSVCMSDSSITSTSRKQFHKQAHFLSVKPLHTCAHTCWPQVQDQWALNETMKPPTPPPKNLALNLKLKLLLQSLCSSNLTRIPTWELLGEVHSNYPSILCYTHWHAKSYSPEPGWSILLQKRPVRPLKPLLYYSLARV